MSQDAQQARYLPRVGSHTHISAVIAAEHIIQHLLAPNILVLTWLGEQLGPVRVSLSEAFLKPVGWEVAMNVRLAAPPIAGMR